MAWEKNCLNFLYTLIWVVLVKKNPDKDMEIFFPAFKFVTISFCAQKPNPLGLGNYSVYNFCKTSFRYF